MGVWEAVCSSADAVRQRLPDPAPVKDASKAAYSAVAGTISGVATPVAGILGKSYDHGRSALSTVEIQRVKESMPAKEALAEIGLRVAHNTLDSYTRPLTGGIPVYRTVVDGLLKNYSKPAGDINAEELKSARKVDEKELKEMRKRIERLEAMLSVQEVKIPVYAEHRMAGLHQNPVDVIRVFMMKGFRGVDFLDDQVILLHEKWRRDVLFLPVSWQPTV